MANTIYTLSPSDFAFLWRDCPRCFYRKVVMGIQPPRSPMPSVFNKIDATMKQRLNEVPVEEFVSGAPNSRVYNHDGRVLSCVYRSEKGGPGIQIRGIYDTVLELADGAFALVDLKTIKVSPKLASTYSHQLHAYAYAMENPSISENRIFPVSRLGLIAFEPGHFTSRGDGSSALVGKNTWVEVEKENQKFFAFLDQVAELLASESLPASGKSCSTCQYLERLGGDLHRLDTAQTGFAVAV